MDELITCSMNCQKKAIYACDCSDNNVFLCRDHDGPHVVSKGNHHFIEIMKKPDPQTKNIISKFLKDIKEKTKQNRIKIIQESSLLIAQIKEVAGKSLEKLWLIEKRTDEYLTLCENLDEINNLNSKSFIESLLKLSAEDAAKVKFEDDIAKINSDNFKEKIENLFIVQETKSLLNTDNFWVFKPHFIKYFKGNDLFAVDVLSQNSTPPNINKGASWNPTCLLDDGSVFCCFQGETFVITLNNSIVALNSPQYSNQSGLIAVEDFVYLFGGGGNASSKFSLKPKNWTAISQYPVSGNYDISCACLNNVILIGGWNSPYIHGYNILSNSYTNALITLSSSAAKTCLATKNKAYIIEYGRNYYESGLNDINSWTSIGAASMLISNQPRQSYSLLYEDSFYFITRDYRLIQFDLKNKQLKHLKTL